MNFLHLKFFSSAFAILPMWSIHISVGSFTICASSQATLTLLEARQVGPFFLGPQKLILIERTLLLKKYIKE